MQEQHPLIIFDVFKRCMLRRQIQWFIELPPSAYVKCLMCGEFDPEAWLMR